MSRSSPFVIVLSDEERVELEWRTRWYSEPYARVARARIVLLAADGYTNADIAVAVGVHVDVVARWRQRFFGGGITALDDRRRSGRPRWFGSDVVAEVKAMACEAPSQRDVPLSRWSSAELAAQAVTEGLVASVSPSTVRRWLAEDAIKPWQCRSWIFPRDPQFATKAARVLDLYETGVGGPPPRTARLCESVPTRSPSCKPCPVVTPPAGPVPAARPGDFADLDELAARLLAFEARYNAIAARFDWTFTRADLVELCRRVEAREPDRPLGLAAWR